MSTLQTPEVPDWLQPGRRIAVVRGTHAHPEVTTPTIERVTKTLAIDSDGERHKLADQNPHGPFIRTYFGGNQFPTGSYCVVPFGAREHLEALVAEALRPVWAANDAVKHWGQEKSNPDLAEIAGQALRIAAVALGEAAARQRSVLAETIAETETAR